MKKRRLKKFVIPLIYGVLVCAVFLSVLLIMGGTKIFKVNDKVQYVMDPIIEDVVPVVSTKNTAIIKPFVSESVSINKEYYEKGKEETTQQKSLIFYQNTYMPNTGVLYSAGNSFDVVAVLDGKVANVKEDSLLGTIIEIEHTESLYTIYQCLNESQVSIGMEVTQGQTIGLSGSTPLVSNPHNLLFEVRQNGQNVDPSVFLTSDVSSLGL